MEELKKELQEKGYTFFNIKDYPEFINDYNDYKKYICNSENNLLNYINKVRIDGHFLKKHGETDSNTRFHVDEQQKTFEDIHKKANQEYISKADLKHLSQYWYYSDERSITDNFKKIINKIVTTLYDTGKTELNHHISLTYYGTGCSLREHRDGKTGTRICAVLMYLNDEDYKQEWGGNIVFEGKETVPPIYGNVAILDFKEGNCLHEVKKVVDGYGRYAILDFVSLGDSVVTPNYY
jgi:hypothetical protein